MHTGSTPVPAVLGNQTKPLVKLAATAMWHGSHVGPFGAGTWGEWRCCLKGTFVELSIFPDLTHGEAVINEKNLPVENHDATLEKRLR